MLQETWAGRRFAPSALRSLHDFRDEPVLFAHYTADDLGPGADEPWKIMTYDQVLQSNNTNYAVGVVVESLTNA